MALTDRCLLAALLGLAALGSGCTSAREYIRNGFKVGPNYRRPLAPLEESWIDADDARLSSSPRDDGDWWTVFEDPVLDQLVQTAYRQNVSLQVAATRVLEARAQRAIAIGTLFPQSQTANGAFDRAQVSRETANVAPVHSFDNWTAALNATWELDFWGSYRRLIESADGVLDASIEDYDNAMVSLIGDVAETYVQYRVFEQQLVFAQQNVELQSGSLKIATAQWKAGQTNELGVVQATSLLEQLESTIPLLEIGKRQASNQLSILLGMPPTDLANTLGSAPIPNTPALVEVGIPADLIRRRPDLRAAERAIAAQNAQIGVAEADLYPSIFIGGTIGYQAQSLDDLFTPTATFGQGGPGFSWNILNYGRIVNNVRLQDYRTQELVAVYQQKVLTAAREVENGLVLYLRAQQQAADLAESVKAAERAVHLASTQYSAGAIDYTPVFVAEQFLSQQQNLLAQAEGDVALGLISVYRAMGGGWEIRLTEPAACPPWQNASEPIADLASPPHNEQE